MNYTKGNWYHSENKISNVDEVCVNGTGERIAMVWHQNDPEQTEANGKLIAAAPELFEALQFLLQSYRADFHTITGAPLNQTDAVKAAEAAIAKVKY